LKKVTSDYEEPEYSGLIGRNFDNISTKSLPIFKSENLSRESLSGIKIIQNNSNSE